MPVFKRALVCEQLSRQRRVVVDGLVRRVLPRTHAKPGVCRIVGFGPRQAGHVANAVALRILDAQGAHRSVVRHPVPKRRLARGPTELRGFLKNENLVPQPPREQGGRQPAGPGADDDDIDLRIEAGRTHWRGRAALRDRWSRGHHDFLPSMIVALRAFFVRAGDAARCSPHFVRNTNSCADSGQSKQICQAASKGPRRPSIRPFW